jgi:hypothetical protein
MAAALGISTCSGLKGPGLGMTKASSPSPAASPWAETRGTSPAIPIAKAAVIIGEAKIF